MNTDFHSSFTVRFRRKFSIDLLERLPPHLSCVALLLHYLAKSENPIQKQSIPVLIIFSFRPLCGSRTVRIWTPSTTRCGSYKSVCTSITGSRTWKSCASMSRTNGIVWTRKWLTTRSANGASDWQPALQLAEDILNIHSEHYCIWSHTD